MVEILIPRRIFVFLPQTSTNFHVDTNQNQGPISSTVHPPTDPQRKHFRDQ